MKNTKDLKKLTIQDVIKIVAVIGAVLILVVGVAAAAEKLGKKRREPVELTPPATTPDVVTEDIVPSGPVTEPNSDTTPEITTPPSTEAPETTPEPTTTPEPVTTPPTTTPEPTTTPAPKTEKPKTTPKAETEKQTEATEPEEEADDNRPLSEMKYNPNIKNIVFLGTDRQDVGENYYYRSGGQSDTIMIFSFDMKKKEYFVVIVNRNMAAPVQTYDRYGNSLGVEEQQICLAHAYGDGSKISAYNTILSLSHIIGSDIKYLGFIEMPMANIGPINDLFGGVTVTIEDDFSGYYNDNTVPFASVNSADFAIGKTITLKGDQAQAYLRARYKMYDDTSNPARMRRQKTYLTSLRNKIKSEMSAKELVSIYDDILDMTMTDMSKAEITKWITSVYDYDFKGFYELEGVEGEKIGGARAYYPDQEETDAIKRLYYK